MQSLLDNQVDKKNMENVDKKPLTLEEAERLVYDCFVSAAEREIHVGDGVCMRIITKNGIEEKLMPLRRDWKSRGKFICGFYAEFDGIFWFILKFLINKIATFKIQIALVDLDSAKIVKLKIDCQYFHRCRYFRSTN